MALPQWIKDLGKSVVDTAGNAASAIADNAAPLALGSAGLLLAKEGYDKVGEVGQDAYEALSGYTEDGKFTPGLAQELQGMFEFQPYTVTTSTGSQYGSEMGESTVDADGNTIPGQMNFGIDLSANEKLFQDAQLKRAESMFGLAAGNTYDSQGVDEEGNPLPSREQDVFNRMMSGIRPEQVRESNRLQGQLQAQGRLGVRTEAYGGTPEGLAMAKAQEESYSQNMLNAMQYAGQEQSRQAQLGAGMLSSSYIPQSQLLSGLQPGMTGAEQRRQSLSQQAETYGSTYASGLQALLQSALGQSGIAGTLGTGLATEALGGMFKR